MQCSHTGALAVCHPCLFLSRRTRRRMRHPRMSTLCHIRPDYQSGHLEQQLVLSAKDHAIPVNLSPPYQQIVDNVRITWANFCCFPPHHDRPLIPWPSNPSARVLCQRVGTSWCKGHLSKHSVWASPKYLAIQKPLLFL